MKNNLLLICLLAACCSLPSCKSELERIRASGNAQEIYKKAFEYYDKGKYLNAQTLFETVMNNYKGKKEAEKLYFSYAYTHYHLQKFILANYYFKQFSSTFTNSPLREEADFMAAYCNFQLSPSFRLEQSYTEKAIDEFQLFVNTYPNSPRVDQCNKLIDGLRKKLERKAFDEGQLYFDMRQYQASIQSFENLLREFPETDDAERVRYLIIRADYQWAQNSVLQKQEERYNATIANVGEFVKKFPKSKYLKEVKLIEKTSATKLKELKHERHQDKSARAGS